MGTKRLVQTTVTTEGERVVELKSQIENRQQERQAHSWYVAWRSRTGGRNFSGRLRINYRHLAGRWSTTGVNGSCGG